jgi:hypothetical protein
LFLPSNKDRVGDGPSSYRATGEGWQNRINADLRKVRYWAPLIGPPWAGRRAF